MSKYNKNKVVLNVIANYVHKAWLNGILVLKCPYHQKFLFSHLMLHFTEWTSAKKFFDLDKKRFCYECLKTWKSYFRAVDPCRWSQHRHAQSCDVVQERATSGLTHLACFTSVNLASWSMQNTPFQHVVWAIKLSLQR